MNDKKSAQKVWPKDLVYKGTFRLSSRTPHTYKISYELLDLVFFFCQLNDGMKKTKRKLTEFCL